MPLSKPFFDSVRTAHVLMPTHDIQLFLTLSQQQVDALNAVTACFDAFTGHDHCLDDLAYIMATCYAECGVPLDLTIEERGKGAGHAYGSPAGPYNKRYYGRGPCQVTWDYNYNKAKLRTAIDFYQFPEYMCEPAKGIVYMIDAMYGGLFTSKGLRTYITPGKVTSFAAFGECRRIINGIDRKDEIAYIAMAFRLALTVGYAPPVKVPSTASQQSPRPQGLWSRVAALFGRKQA